MCIYPRWFKVTQIYSPDTLDEQLSREFSPSQKRQKELKGFWLLTYYSTKTHILTSWWFQSTWKNISQNGNLPQVGVKIKNISNRHLDNQTLVSHQVLQVITSFLWTQLKWPDIQADKKSWRELHLEGNQIQGSFWRRWCASWVYGESSHHFVSGQ